MRQSTPKVHTETTAVPASTLQSGGMDGGLALNGALDLEEKLCPLCTLPRSTSKADMAASGASLQKG